jgi:hypothetical protein
LGVRRTRRDPLRLAGVLVAAVAAVLGARLALGAWIAARARRALAAVAGAHGTFARADVRVRDLSCTLRGVRFERRGGPGGAPPVLEIAEARVRLRARPLLRGRVVAQVELERPALNVVQRRKPPPEPAPGAPRQIAEAPRAGSGPERLPALVVERAQVRGGVLRIIDLTHPSAPELRLHGIELSVENLPTRPALAGEGPTVLAGRGTLARSGALTVFATADPRARRATFAGQGRLTGLRLEELRGLVAARSRVAPDEGVLDLVVRFEADAGAVSGAVRPTVQGGGTRAATPGLVAWLESALADRSLDLFEEDSAATAEGATTIPLRGTLAAAAAPLPAIIGVLRNAFVQGLTAALRGPPSPEVSGQTPGQARRAVAPRRGRGSGGAPPAGPGEGAR